MTYDPEAERDVFCAIGKATARWVDLESDVDAFIQILAGYLHPAFDDEEVNVVLRSITVNLDVRKLAIAAKALAFRIDDIEGFYERVAALMGEIGNNLRNERNRFMHDRWLTTDKHNIRRVEAGTKITNAPSSGKRQIRNVTYHEYADVSAVYELAAKIEAANHQLSLLINEVLEALDRKRPLGGTSAPIPQE